MKEARACSSFFSKARLRLLVLSLALLLALVDLVVSSHAPPQDLFVDGTRDLQQKLRVDNGRRRDEGRSAKVQEETCASEVNAQKFIDGYTSKTYEKMRDDRVRTSSYLHAIQHLVRDRVVLDIGTGALALLAIFAAEAGARKVYAIEANKEAFQVASKTVAERGLSDRIELIFGHSTQVKVPEKVDMLVHEILGEIASIEGAAYVIRDAQKRHLKEFPSKARTSIPVSASSFICPCEMPDSDYWQEQEFPVILPPDATTLKLWRFPQRSLLSEEWKGMEELDFEKGDGLPLVQQRSNVFQVARRGTFQGFVIKMQASLLDEGSEEIQTWCWDNNKQKEECKGHWAQQVILFQAASDVDKGDEILLQTTVDTSRVQPTYRFAAQLRRKGSAEEQLEDLGERILNLPNFG